METREQLLRRYMTLKEKARQLVATRHHWLHRFERVRTIGHAKCQMCSAEVWVRLFPINNETAISGTASTTDCTTKDEP